MREGDSEGSVDHVLYLEKESQACAIHEFNIYPGMYELTRTVPMRLFEARDKRCLQLRDTPSM